MQRGKKCELLIGFPFVRQFPCLHCLVSLTIYCTSLDIFSYQCRVVDKQCLPFYRVQFSTRANGSACYQIIVSASKPIRLINYRLINITACFLGKICFEKLKPRDISFVLKFVSTLQSVFTTYELKEWFIERKLGSDFGVR